MNRNPVLGRFIGVLQCATGMAALMFGSRGLRILFDMRPDLPTDYTFGEAFHALLAMMPNIVWLVVLSASLLTAGLWLILFGLHRIVWGYGVFIRRGRTNDSEGVGHDA
ncbi:hypothetical protein [Bifidobacterium felsineum]|uniref:hypothetical protein n=1 Tax=Bifidobacterium felsineum TaxID=2045440 RepID=UPI001BDDAD7F|nr:hypothetical protein [Bifidobacterium felsineum]MBT1164619.1 hypothetical protein [Bifidobacterium felsineum]